MRRFFTFGPALLVLLTVTVTLIAAPEAVRRVQFAQISATVTQARAELERGSILDRIDAETAALSDAVFPSVVHLSVRFQTESERGFMRPSFTSGSGWVWSDEGYIVTNAHVVQNATRVTAELFDGRVERGRVVGVDPLTDIAVVQIDPGAGLVPMARATNERLRVGERVYAFGSPFSIKFSMSEGIVSGLGRSEAASFLNMIGGYTNFIQTDAAMNPGNSGGPLVDVNGMLVGMNAAIANNINSQRDSNMPELQGQSAGIGFAIPLDTVEAVVRQLINEDANIVLRGYLGINLSRFDLNASVARELGYAGQGVLVAATPAGQPAAKGGLERGDVITHIDAEEITSIDILRSIVSNKTPGEGVVIRYWRPDNRGGGEFGETTVRLGAAYNLEQGGLRYVPGSEDMSRNEIIDAINGSEASPLEF